jgi:outer membrane protein TolC
MRGFNRRTALFLAAVLTLGTATGCQMLGRWARKSADAETYPIVEQKQREALGRTMALSIDPTTDALTQEVLADAGTWTSESDEEQPTTGGLTIGLADALAIAIANNVEWQSRQEELYLSALSLTDERHAFSPIFSGAVAARAVREPAGGGLVERFGSVVSDLAVTRLFATGARVTVGMNTSLSRLFTEPETRTAQGTFSASLVQPLLQGFGSLVTTENLVQAERDVIYDVRSFDRFRKSFIVDRINDYYRLLQAHDEIENEWQAYQRLVISRERAEALQEAERWAAFEVDQARQAEIRARNRWISSKAAYINSLNAFKVTLGLPTELNIQPDPRDLDALNRAGLVEIAIGLAQAERAALTNRLDYRTALGVVEDNQRGVMIAANGLLPAVDVRADYSVVDTGENQPFDLNASSRRYSGGVTAELPLDRKFERNDYRRAEIALTRARREAGRLRDDIVLEVRRAHQDLQEARQTYGIQVTSMELARRQVDNVSMLLEAGREGIDTLDELDAQAALRDAQNAITQALVDYTIARLRFYNAIESLEIDERGMWNEGDQ